MRLASVGDVADLDRTKMFLRSVRELVPSLYVTGGEPLVLNDIEQRLTIARDLEFYPLCMNTNAMLLDRHWGVLGLVDTLVVSLHSVEPVKLASTYLKPVSLVERAIGNIKRAAKEGKTQGTDIMANCVLSPDNISGADDVLDFCLENGIILATVPAIVDQEPLFITGDQNKRVLYEKFLDRVMAQKRKDPRSIQGTNSYLRQIRDLGRVHCRPSGIMSVDPQGNVLGPCDLRHASIGRVERDRSAHTVLLEGLDYSEWKRGQEPFWTTESLFCDKI